MKNKKAKWFLWIGFTLFALSVIACILYMVTTYYEEKANYSDDREMAALRIVELCLIYFMIIPALGSELSFIRSVYHILKHRPRWIVNICYIISAGLACLAFIFAWLMLYEVSILPAYSMDLMIIVFQWPIFIVSFLLGSVPVKRKEPCDNDRIDLQNDTNIS